MTAGITLTGNQLWYIRQTLGMTQGQFAEVLDVNQVRVFRFEQRMEADLASPDPNDPLIKAIAKAEESGIAIPDPEVANAARIKFETERSEPKVDPEKSEVDA